MLCDCASKPFLQSRPFFSLFFICLDLTDNLDPRSRFHCRLCTPATNNIGCWTSRSVTNSVTMFSFATQNRHTHRHFRCILHFHLALDPIIKNDVNKQSWRKRWNSHSALLPCTYLFVSYCISSHPRDIASDAIVPLLPSYSMHSPAENIYTVACWTSRISVEHITVWNAARLSDTPRINLTII